MKIFNPQFRNQNKFQRGQTKINVHEDIILNYYDKICRIKDAKIKY